MLTPHTQMQNCKCTHIHINMRTTTIHEGLKQFVTFKKWICIGDLVEDTVHNKFTEMWHCKYTVSKSQQVQISVTSRCLIFSVTCTGQCKDSLFEVDCSDSRASFFFFSFFFSFCSFQIFFFHKCMTFKMTGHKYYMYNMQQ